MEYIKLEKDTEIDAAKEGALENFMAVLFVQGSNRKIYGNSLKNSEQGI